MKNFNACSSGQDISKKIYFLVFIWLISIAYIVVVQHAPSWLNADTLLNSVMALQNLTLYYWGQNRLLNILPAATLFIREPSWNLAAVLFTSSLVFFSFLFVLSRIAAFLVNPANRSLLSLQIFILISSIFLSTFTSEAKYEIAIGHIEYSLPALLLVIAVLPVLTRKDYCIKTNLCQSAAIILAIGMNPSTIIPAVFISFAFVFYQKRVGINELVFGVFSVIVFVFWNYLSKLYGDLPYNQFEFNLLPVGLEKVSIGLLSALCLPAFLLLAVIWASWKIIYLLKIKFEKPFNDKLLQYIYYCVLVFSAGWMFLFCSSRWVEMNQYGWRYFIYIFFGFLFLASIEIAKITSWMNRKVSIWVTITVGLAVIGFNFSLPIPFDKYSAFQRVNQYSSPGKIFYSGDYWVVWPSVLRDMIQGNLAYGLTYRGDANRKVARQYVLDKIENDGYATVACLNDNLENCVSQVNRILGPVDIKESVLIKKKVYEIKLTKWEPYLKYEGEEILRLPSTTGISHNGVRKSNGKSGFLVYGPYVPFEAGWYYLTVFGTSNKEKNKSFVEVVSERGEKNHGKYNLRLSKDELLLDKVLIVLNEDVTDMEVRVWVDQDEQIILKGYKLETKIR